MDELQQYKQRLRIALRAAKVCIFEVDLEKQLYIFFENAEVIFGVSGDVILNDVRPFSELAPREYMDAVSRYFSHPDDAAVIETAFSNIFAGRTADYEARMRAGGSDYVWCRINVVPVMENGRPLRMIGVITDITEQKATTDSLNKAARIDALTMLYNKGYSAELIKSALRRRSGTHVLAVLDIDNFKKLNDTYGHGEGDRVIRAVADRIRKTFRDTDITGRFGGDEFIVLLKDVKRPRELRAKFGSLLRYEVDGLLCTVSAGVAVYPEDGESFEELFEKADSALYRAKTAKETVLFYNE